MALAGLGPRSLTGPAQQPSRGLPRAAPSPLVTGSPRPHPAGALIGQGRPEQLRGGGDSAKLGGHRREVTATWPALRRPGHARGPHAGRKDTTQRQDSAITERPWLETGAVTLHPVQGSAHLSACGASTLGFLGFGSSAAAIFALPLP